MKVFSRLAYAKRLKRWVVLPVGAGALLTLGCSGGPGSVDLPSFDPATAGAKAMEMYDTDGDGFVAGEELEKAPGIKAGLKNLDADGDGKVSAEEVAARVQRWKDSQLGLMNFSVTVLLDGKPMPEGVVTYMPEEFLGDAITAATSEINYGDANPMIPKENRPTPETPPGVQPGLYKVQVSHVVDGQETIPAAYNTETTLGHEVSRDDQMLSEHRVIFRVKSK